MDARIAIAIELLGSDELLRVQKAHSELFFSELEVLKFFDVGEGHTLRTLEQEVKRLELLGVVSPVRLHLGRSPDFAAVTMKRLNWHHQLASQIYRCACLDVLSHIESSIRALSALRAPKGAFVERPAIANAMVTNLQRQLVDGELPHEMRASVLQYVDTLEGAVSKWANAPAGEIVIDGHANLFSTNIWHVDGAVVALDPASEPRLRPMPMSVRWAGVIVDFLFLHRRANWGDQSDRRFGALVKGTGSVNPTEDSLMVVALVIKALVRLRFAQKEASLRDDVGQDRILDRRILDNGEFVLSQTLSLVSELEV